MRIIPYAPDDVVRFTDEAVAAMSAGNVPGAHFTNGPALAAFLHDALAVT